MGVFFVVFSRRLEISSYVHPPAGMLEELSAESWDKHPFQHASSSSLRTQIHRSIDRMHNMSA